MILKSETYHFHRLDLTRQAGFVVTVYDEDGLLPSCRQSRSLGKHDPGCPPLHGLGCGVFCFWPLQFSLNAEALYRDVAPDSNATTRPRPR